MIGIWIGGAADRHVPVSIPHKQHQIAFVAERLRRETRNLLGSPRAGSNPAECACLHAVFLVLLYFSVGALCQKSISVTTLTSTAWRTLGLFDAFPTSEENNLSESLARINSNEFIN